MDSEEDGSQRHYFYTPKDDAMQRLLHANAPNGRGVISSLSKTTGGWSSDADSHGVYDDDYYYSNEQVSLVNSYQTNKQTDENKVVNQFISEGVTYSKHIISAADSAHRAKSLVECLEDDMSEVCNHFFRKQYLS